MESAFQETLGGTGDIARRDTTLLAEHRRCGERDALRAASKPHCVNPEGGSMAEQKRGWRTHGRQKVSLRLTLVHCDHLEQTVVVHTTAYRLN